MLLKLLKTGEVSVGSTMTKRSCYRKEKFKVVAYRKSNYCLIGEPSFSQFYKNIFYKNVGRAENGKFVRIFSRPRFC